MALIPMPSRRRNSGYVLLMVLLVLSLAGLTLGAAALHSSRTALEAAHRREELQTRWAVRSLGETLLSHPELALRDSDVSPRRQTPPTVIPLGDLHCAAVLTDENAKANVNQLARIYSLEEFRAVLRGLSSTEGAAPPLRDDLIALDATGEPITPLEYYRSFDQVFQLSGPPITWDPVAERMREHLGPLTCWTDGRLNPRTAGQDAMDAHLGDCLSDSVLRSVWQEAQSSPIPSLEALLDRVKVPEQQRETILRRLVLESNVFGVWIFIPHRTRIDYHVRISRGPKRHGESFLWQASWQ